LMDAIPVGLHYITNNMYMYKTLTLVIKY